MKDYSTKKAHIEEHSNATSLMGLPFRRKGSDGKNEDLVDPNLEEIINSVDGLEEIPPIHDTEEQIDGDMPEEEGGLEQKMAKSAITVIDTCMDLRRGENILIVCDSTTTEVGQALHNAASLRSDRVLLIVMPKGKIGRAHV